MADLSHLLEPIAGEHPTGVDLRYVDGDLTFQTVGEFRVEQDPALSFDGEPKSADWRKLVAACIEALASKTKDLELAGFLAEGLAHTEGFAGARDGLALVKGLLEKHWDTLHPGYEDGEIIPPLRARPLAWLGNPRCFVVAIKNIGLIPSASRQLSWRDFENSQFVDEAKTQSDQTKYTEMIAAGFINGEAFKQAVGNASTVVLEEVLGKIDACAAEVGEIVRIADERLGEDTPSLYELERLLGEMGDMFRPLVTAASGGESGAADGDFEAGAVASAGGASGSAAAGGPLRTRAEALHALEEVAKYFSQTEPHSPISHLIRRAVRWGKMPLEDLLKEVVKSPDALTHIWETLGIEPPPQAE